MTTAVRSELTSTGVAVLLAYGAQLLPPKGACPGLACTDLGGGYVAIKAHGYATRQRIMAALDGAAAVCEDGGLVVLDYGPLTPHFGLVVRRRHH